MHAPVCRVVGSAGGGLFERAKRLHKKRMSERADGGKTFINKIVASVGERHSNESKEGLSLGLLL